MECDICVTEQLSFMICRLCKKKWCEACYDNTVAKNAIKYKNKLYKIKSCPWCRKQYVYGSKLASPHKVNLKGSSMCVIT
jgi:hypothetical protein